MAKKHIIHLEGSADLENDDHITWFQHLRHTFEPEKTGVKPCFWSLSPQDSKYIARCYSIFLRPTTTKDNKESS